jgi:hypothetical protein
MTVESGVEPGNASKNENANDVNGAKCHARRLWMADSVWRATRELALHRNSTASHIARCAIKALVREKLGEIPKAERIAATRYQQEGFSLRTIYVPDATWSEFRVYTFQVGWQPGPLMLLALQRYIDAAKDG